jgi:hypothetical protein
MITDEQHSFDKGYVLGIFNTGFQTIQKQLLMVYTR